MKYPTIILSLITGIMSTMAMASNTVEKDYFANLQSHKNMPVVKVVSDPSIHGIRCTVIDHDSIAFNDIKCFKVNKITFQQPVSPQPFIIADTHKEIPTGWSAWKKGTIYRSYDPKSGLLTYTVIQSAWGEKNKQNTFTFPVN